MRILIVEDEVTRASALSELLTAAGHQTDFLFTVRGMSRGKVAGNGPDGNDTILELANFDIAFVDGVLGDKSKFHGWHVMPMLVSSKLVCIAMSRDNEFNKRMTDAGAHLAVLKDNLRQEHTQLLETAVTMLAGMRP